MRYEYGDIVIVDFPFSDWSKSKRRPALVLAHDLEDDVVLARITSKPRESATDWAMQDWKSRANRRGEGKSSVVKQAGDAADEAARFNSPFGSRGAHSRNAAAGFGRG